MTPEEERQHLITQLQEIGLETLQEWMRLVDLTDVADINFQARVCWQDSGGECVVEEVRGGGLGRFRIIVNVEPLPPIGPEDGYCERCDIDTHRCPGCGESVQHGEVACNNCAPAVAGASATRVDGTTLEESPRPEGPPWWERPEHRPIWVERPIRDVRRGDVIRPAGQEGVRSRVTDRYWPPQKMAAGVRQSQVDVRAATSWHVVPGRRWQDDVVVKAGEVCVVLDGGAPRFMDPSFLVEILLDPQEARAIELMGWDNRVEMLGDLE